MSQFNGVSRKSTTTLYVLSALLFSVLLGLSFYRRTTLAFLTVAFLMWFPMIYHKWHGIHRIGYAVIWTASVLIITFMLMSSNSSESFSSYFISGLVILLSLTIFESVSTAETHFVVSIQHVPRFELCLVMVFSYLTFIETIKTVAISVIFLVDSFAVFSFFFRKVAKKVHCDNPWKEIVSLLLALYFPISTSYQSVFVCCYLFILRIWVNSLDSPSQPLHDYELLERGDNPFLEEEGPKLDDSTQIISLELIISFSVTVILLTLIGIFGIYDVLTVSHFEHRGIERLFGSASKNNANRFSDPSVNDSSYRAFQNGA